MLLICLFLRGKLGRSGGGDMEDCRATNGVREGRTAENGGKIGSFSHLEKLVAGSFKAIRCQHVSLQIFTLFRIREPDWFFPSLPFLSGQRHFFGKARFFCKYIFACLQLFVSLKQDLLKMEGEVLLRRNSVERNWDGAEI